MSCNGACGPLSKTEGTYRGRVADNSAVVSDRERGLTEVSCNGACGPLSKTEGTYRGRVADNSAVVSDRERGLTEVSCNGACGPLTKTEGSCRWAGGGGGGRELLTISDRGDLLRCPAMVPVGHSPRLNSAPAGGGGRELLTISDRGELTEVSCNGGNGIRGTLAETERTYKKGGGGGGGVIERDPDDSEVVSKRWTY